MAMYTCYWCRKRVEEEHLIRRDSRGFCSSGCIVAFVNNGCQRKAGKRKD